MTKTLLVDADSIAYRLGFKHDLIEDSFSEDEHLTIEDSYVAPWNSLESEVKTIIKAELDEWMKLTSTDTLELHVSYKACIANQFAKRFQRQNQDCFRYVEAACLEKAYKHNRAKIHLDTPWKTFLKSLVYDFKADIHDYVEADDVVVRRKLDNPDFILAAIDKDVLYQCPGIHFNYVTNDIVQVSEEYAIYYKYLQCLIGDTSDGYIGVKGIGKKKAEKIIDQKMSESELWGAVLETFIENKYTEEQAIATMRLASMRQLKGFTPTDISVDRYELELFNGT